MGEGTGPEEPKIDLGPLDPTRDRAAWERLLGATLRRVRTQRVPLGVALARQLQAWARPALLVAFALALVCGTAALVLRPAAAHRVERDGASTLADWAAADEVPAPAQVFGLFGGAGSGSGAEGAR